jgi:glycosyltransferase involved in cell wall biosynthesis
MRKTRRVRTELGIGLADRIVCTVTQLRTESGTEFLVRAAPAILEHCRDALFLIAGDVPRLGYLKQLNSDLRVSERVRFLGFRAYVHELLSALDGLVLPSLTEGFPLSLVEGFAAGCPNVATRVDGVPEVAQDVVPSAYPVAISRRILEIVESAELAARLARAARTTAERCSAGEATSRVAQLYQTLLRSAGAAERAELAAPPANQRSQ